ncbi:MAG TPA: molecular chaperone DnaJ [Candidatus Saccharimonadales bacterium]|nr:molecular chaperone DnaJ [Candidatus Saccharimonadales bacterium]
MAKRDYYEVLGIAKDASADEIKKAFRRLAVQYHPDKEGGNETKFKEINEAYEVLKDPSKRQRYDQFGHAGVGSSAAGDGNPFGAGFNGFGGQGQNVNFDFGDLGLGDIFESFFGGQGGNRGRGPARGRDVETRVEVSFEEAIFGAERTLELNLEAICTHCKGTTAEPGYELKTCDTCGGHGQVTQVVRTIFGNIQQASVCPKCHGKGKIPEKPCSVCNGKGTTRQAQSITLKIPAGIDDGATIRLREHGEAIAGGPKGDLYVGVRVKAHKKFTRESDLILSEEHIGMASAALGTEIDVETVDGPIRMKIPAGTQSGTDFKLSGHGVPHLRGNGRGAHIVTVIVDTPQNLSREQRAALEQFASLDDKKHFWQR